MIFDDIKNYAICIRRANVPSRDWQTDIYFTDVFAIYSEVDRIPRRHGFKHNPAYKIYEHDLTREELQYFNMNKERLFQREYRDEYCEFYSPKGRSFKKYYEKLHPKNRRQRGEQK